MSSKTELPVSYLIEEQERIRSIKPENPIETLPLVIRKQIEAYKRHIAENESNGNGKHYPISLKH